MTVPTWLSNLSCGLLPDQATSPQKNAVNRPVAATSPTTTTAQRQGGSPQTTTASTPQEAEGLGEFYWGSFIPVSLRFSYQILLPKMPGRSGLKRPVRRLLRTVKLATCWESGRPSMPIRGECSTWMILQVSTFLSQSMHDFLSVKFGWDLYALLNVKVIEASGLPAADINVISSNSSDPYTVLTLLEDNVGSYRLIQLLVSPLRWPERPRYVSRLYLQCGTLSVPLWWWMSPARRWKYKCKTIVHRPLESWAIYGRFDYDMASDDDLLGTAYIDLTNLIPGEPTNGWLPLVGEDGSIKFLFLLHWFLRLSGKPAGAIHLELMIMYTPSSERIAFVQEAMVPRPKPKPKFDINALYGPGM